MVKEPSETSPNEEEPPTENDAIPAHIKKLLTCKRIDANEFRELSEFFVEFCRKFFEGRFSSTISYLVITHNAKEKRLNRIRIDIRERLHAGVST